jgi:hypothetical protein
MVAKVNCEFPIESLTQAETRAQEYLSEEDHYSSDPAVDTSKVAEMIL